MLRFGPSGNSDKFFEDGNKETIQAFAWLDKMGLNAFEYSFTLGRYLRQDTAQKLGEEAKKYNIEISGHAPYFINFCNNTDISKENNAKFILNTLNSLKNMGGKRCIFHIGAQMKMAREDALNNLKTNFLEFLPTFYEQNYEGMYLMPETMGKYSQIGNVDEILEICSWDKSLIPCFDFGHINCIMQGALKTKDDYMAILEKGIQKIGLDKMNKCHIHFSKIKYGEKGEIAHLTFDDRDYGPDFEPMIDALCELKLNPVIICESKGTQAIDAKMMSDYYKTLSK
ncbi:MAG: TIM barrel protein [Clostridia bacterium]|nr:TIM barrel protein [Clostridia bacterium]